MPANLRKGAIIGAILGLSALSGLAATSGASAQTPRRAAHHKVAPGPREWPLAPGVELHASTSASVGAENRYFADTVASTHSDLMDLSHRYMQQTQPMYNDTPDPLIQW
jgi:hypothetical protein